jgi:hypothetical protein
MFVPAVEAGLPTVLALRKTWDAVLNRVDGRLLCVASIPILRDMTIVSERPDGSLVPAMFLPGVPEPSDLQVYLSETHVRADTLYAIAAYLRKDYGHWIVSDRTTKDELAGRLELYANLINLSKGV